jgi:Fe-S cluster assembly protein SufD
MPSGNGLAFCENEPAMSSASATMPPSATGGFGEESFEGFLKGRDEPSWLRERRREALATFLASPWPTARDEEWRRTDIRALKLDSFAPPARREPSPDEIAALDPAWNALSNTYGAGIAQVNGAPVRGAEPDRLR